jgi:hypothetical protein
MFGSQLVNALGLHPRQRVIKLGRFATRQWGLHYRNPSARDGVVGGEKVFVVHANNPSSLLNRLIIIAAVQQTSNTQRGSCSNGHSAMGTTRAVTLHR